MPELMLAIRPALRPLVLSKTRWTIGVAHRRAGKTVGAVQRAILRALNCTLPNPRVGYVAPTYGQAKRAAWDYLKLIAEPVLADTPHESELRVTLVNGARVQLFGAENQDALRGQYFDDVVMDEYADMPPSIWPLVIRPALSDRGGTGLFIGTPKGRNEFAFLWDRAADDPEWTRVMLRASETGLLPAHELDAARRDMTPEAFDQEYECSFDAAILGAYYGRDIAEAERAGRISDGIERDPALPVQTAWDLGIGDSTAIWVWQAAPDGVRVLDYIEDHGKALPHYVSELNARGWTIQTDWLPHDAEARELGTGRTREETLRKLGRTLRVLPRQNAMDRINAVRVMFPRIHIKDTDETRKGVEALRQYRAEYDEKTKAFRDKPRHDWTSHAADAFGYMCQAYRDLTPAKPQDPYRKRYRRDKPASSGWAA